MIKAIVFDLDDTLYPEREYVIQGFAEVGKVIDSDYDFDGATDILIDLFDQDHSNVYNRTLDKIGAQYDRDYINKLVAIYRNFPRKNLHLYPDVASALNKLRSVGYAIAVISDGRLDCQQNKVDALDLSKYIDYCVLTGALGEDFYKPHPKAFEMTAQALQVDFNEMVYIGDNRQKDFAISAVYPIVTIEIIRERPIHNNSEYLNGIKPTYKINNLTQLFELL